MGQQILEPQTHTNENTFGNFSIEEEDDTSKDENSSPRDGETNGCRSTYEQSFKESYDEWMILRDQRK